MVSIFRMGWQKNKVRLCILQALHSEFREAEMRLWELQSKTNQQHRGTRGDKDRYQGELIARDNQPLFCRKVKSALPSTLNSLVEVSLQ